MSTPSENRTSHLLANCLDCQGLVRVPATARPNQSVSCPHCGVSFSLERVLDQQVPEVQFLNGEAPPAVGSAAINVGESSAVEQVEQAPVIEPGSKFQVPPQLAKGVRRRKRRRRSREKSSPSGTEASENSKARRDERRREEAAAQAAALSVGTGPGTEVVTDSAASSQMAPSERAPSERSSSQNGSSQRSSRSESGERSRSRQRSSSSRNAQPESRPFFEWLKIVLGGALAIPIAYLMLLWVFGRDPLSLAPTIYQIIPAAVPEYMVVEEEPVEETPAKTGKARNRLPVPETDPDDIGEIPGSVL